LTDETSDGNHGGMKPRHTYFDRPARRALAIVFACLFIFQAVGFFHTAAAMAAPAQQKTVAETILGTAVAGEHCDRLAHPGAPDHSQCDHAGFCPFCSASDRDAALLGAPPPSPVIAVLAPGDEPAGRFARNIERSTPLPSSSGLDESRFATAPPRV
jgi:hypothetical protein